MTNNDILRRIRYIFDLNDTQMMTTFSLGGLEASRSSISDWLKPEDNPEFKAISDTQFAHFLNGLITLQRGPKPGAQPPIELELTNNLILRKLKIALNFEDSHILDCLALAKFPLGKHELSAFFRRPDHKNYRPCNNQIMRNFLTGLQLQRRGHSRTQDDAAASTAPNS